MLHRSLAALVAALALLAAPSDATAQGLVQLRLDGVIGLDRATPTDGVAWDTIAKTGHLVEIEVTALVRQTPREVVLHLHLAKGTTGAELAKIVVSRLGRADILAEATLVEPNAGSIWIDDATRINVRGGGGMGISVACVAGPPASVSVHAPSAVPLATILSIGASTATPVKGRPPVRAHRILAVSLAAEASPSEAATALWKAATQQKWETHRPGGDSWAPTGMVSGAEITGLSLTLDHRADWRLDVVL